MTAISIDHLSKQYRLGGSPQGGGENLREALSRLAWAPWRGLRRLLGGQCDASRNREPFWALRDVSLHVQPGEMLGVIGHNGAGKSTLLKILSRIVEPTSGRAVVRGRIGSLLEVGTGFHPELTGRENIYLSGAILNMSRREIDRKFSAIVEFAEIADFLDTPVRHYSSGMYVRLGFSVAAHMDPDILLIDEVLSVGDLRFQRKCMEFAQRLRQRRATVVVVSHNMFAIKAMCGRAAYLAHGRLCFDGGPEEAIQRYEQASRLSIAGWAQSALGTDPARRPIHITSIDVLDEDGRPRGVFTCGERIRVRLRYRARERISQPNFVVSFLRSDGVACCCYSTALDQASPGAAEQDGCLELLTPAIKLVAELYSIQALVWDAAFQRLHCAQNGPSFHVRHEVLSTHFGVFHEPGEWAIEGPQATPADGVEPSMAGIGEANA
jgi:lipopolysaccharide transport system ATP-binding protein